MNLDFLVPLKPITLQFIMHTQLNIIGTFINVEPFTVKASATILVKFELITEHLMVQIWIQDLD